MNFNEDAMRNAKFILVELELYKKMIPDPKKEWKKEMERRKNEY